MYKTHGCSRGRRRGRDTAQSTVPVMRIDVTACSGSCRRCRERAVCVVPAHNWERRGFCRLAFSGKDFLLIAPALLSLVWALLLGTGTGISQTTPKIESKLWLDYELSAIFLRVTKFFLATGTFSPFGTRRGLAARAFLNASRSISGGAGGCSLVACRAGANTTSWRWDNVRGR